MARVSLDSTYLTNIADAIRTKASSSNTYTPSEMASAILNLPGGTVNLNEFMVRPDAQKWKSISYDETASDLQITIPAYTTSSTTLQTSANLSPTYTLDLTSYDYCVVVKALTIPTYSITTKAKGRQEYSLNVYVYELEQIPANTIHAFIDNTKYITSDSYFWATQTHVREIYYSSGTAITAYASAAYGCNQTIIAPSLSSSTLTLRRPTFIIRGNTTYFVNTFMNAVTDIRFQFVQDIWRAPKNNLNIDGWGGVHLFKQSLADAQSTSHKLT